MNKKEKETTNPMNDEFIIDVDIVIDKYNAANPDLKQLTRADLAADLENNKQLFVDWKSGTKTPHIVKKLMRLM